MYRLHDGRVEGIKAAVFVSFFVPLGIAVSFIFCFVHF